MKKIVDLDDIIEIKERLRDGIAKDIVDSMIRFIEKCPDASPSLKPKSHKKGTGIHGEHFTDFRNAYVDFYFRQTGFMPTMGQTEKTQLSAIISKLHTISQEDYTKALEGWRMIFQEWHNLNDFLKAQIELTPINKRLPEIIAKLIKAQKPENSALGKYA